MRQRSYAALQSVSVLWHPDTGLPRTEVEAYPIFVEQPVLVAVEEHLSSAPDQGLLGFLVGRVSECLETGISYVHVHAAIRLPQTLTYDQSEPVVTQSWGAAQRLLRPSDGEIVGWYHSHPEGDLSLSPSDRRAHAGLFPEPWHVALVLSIGREETTGEFVRVAADLAAAPLPLSFYEVLDPALRDGWKRSRVSWSNHWSPDPAVWPATSTVVLEPPIDSPLPPVPIAPTRPRRATPAAPEPAQLVGPHAVVRGGAPPAAREPAQLVGPHPLAPSPFGRGGSPPAAPEPAQEEMTEAKPSPRRRASGPFEPAPYEIAEARPRRAGVTSGQFPRSRRERGPGGEDGPAPSEFRQDEMAEAKPRRRGRAPALRVASLVAGGAALLAAAAFAGSRFAGQRQQTSAVLMAAPPPAHPASAPSGPALSHPAAATDAVHGDSLQRALEAYQQRATQFAAGEVACEELGHAMVEIDAQWIQYNLARTRAVNTGSGAGVSDSARLASDQALAGAVEQAEGDFERTGCPRP